MILVVPHEQAEDISHRLQGLGERVYVIGEVERKRAEGDPPITFDPGYLGSPERARRR